MSNPWWQEAWRATGLLLVAVLIGALIDRVGAVLFVVAAGYLVWHVRNLYLLERWLRTGAGPQPESARGVWGEVHFQLYRMRQRHRRRKRTISGYLNRFREFTRALPDATVVVRPSGEIEWFNDAAERLLGLRTPQDVGQRIVNLVRHPTFTQFMLAKKFHEAVEFVSPVDEHVRLSLRVVPAGSEQLLLVARDVTRLYRLEQTRRDFVANVSHELRTPLTVLAGFLENLREAPDVSAEERAHALALMSEQTVRMQHIVDDLLLLSRLEAEERPTRREIVDVPGLLQSMQAEADSMSGGRHRINIEAESGLLLRGDGAELRSAFTNLVSNAVRYTPEGGTITLRWRRDENGACFEVQDTGAGIAPHHLPRLSERFYRVDAGRSRQTGGTGLGLAIVKHVLERHNARLTIASRVGAGSTFACHFPGEVVVAPRPQVQAQAQGL